MTTQRKEFSATDAQPVILYGKTDRDSQFAYPLLSSPDGSLTTTSGIDSTLNTTTTPLGGSATYTGTWEKINAADVMVACKTDVAGTLYFDFSPDGVNADSTFPVNGFTLTAGVSEFHIARKGPRYFRVRLVNGSAAQSYLRLYTYYGYFGQSNVPINQSISGDADATIVHSIDEETDLVSGKYGTDRFTITKFGRNTDVDKAAVEDIWNGGLTYTGFPTSTLETVTITSASGATDAAATVYVSGLDGNYAIQTETVTLNGSGVGVTANTYRRLNRAYVVDPAAGQTTNNGVLTATHTTTTGNVFFSMPAGYGQTQIAAYTIPAGYTGYLRSYRASMQDATANSGVLAFWTRENGKAVRIQRPFAISTSFQQETKLYSGIAFPEKTDIAVRALSVANDNADISSSFGVLLIKN